MDEDIAFYFYQSNVQTLCLFFFLKDRPPPDIYPLPLHAPLPIARGRAQKNSPGVGREGGEPAPRRTGLRHHPSATEPCPQVRGPTDPGPWARGRSTRHDLESQSLRSGRSVPRRVGAPDGAVPVAGGPARGDARAVGAAARAGALRRVDAGRARRVGEERGLGDRPAGRAGGHHRRRAAHRPTALYGTGAALDAAVHLDTTGRRAAARDPERRDVHAGARATPRARGRVRRG